MRLPGSRLADLRAQAHHLTPSLHVGKQGTTDAFVKEVVSALKRDHLVKVRLTGGALGTGARKDLARDLAERTGSLVVEVKGNTVVLYRPTRGERARPE